MVVEPEVCAVTSSALIVAVPGPNGRNTSTLNSPETSGWGDALQTPEYGVLAPWDVGHLLRFESQWRKWGGARETNATASAAISAPFGSFSRKSSPENLTGETKE